MSNEAKVGCEPCATHARVEGLIERSSLGSAEAKAARESVPREVGSAIALAAKYLGRAEEAEAKVARVEALADEWSGPESHRANAWVHERVAGDRLRGALDQPATDAPYAMPGLGEVADRG